MPECKPIAISRSAICDLSNAWAELSRARYSIRILSRVDEIIDGEMEAQEAVNIVTHHLDGLIEPLEEALRAMEAIEHEQRK